MRVEVAIFSGRPSPFWTASPQEAEALTDRLGGGAEGATNQK